MRKLFTLFALAVGLSAQTTTTTISVTGPATVTAGNSFTLTLSAAGTATQGIVALQWSLAMPTGFTLGAPVLANSDPTGDVGVCGTAACLIYGSLTSIADGTLTTLPVTVLASAAPGTQTLNVSGLFAATKDGFNVNGLTAGTAYTVKVLSRCDLNGDGSINMLDVSMVVNGIVSRRSMPDICGEWRMLSDYAGGGVNGDGRGIVQDLIESGRPEEFHLDSRPNSLEIFESNHIHIKEILSPECRNFKQFLPATLASGRSNHSHRQLDRYAALRWIACRLTPASCPAREFVTWEVLALKPSVCDEHVSGSAGRAILLDSVDTSVIGLRDGRNREEKQ